MLKYFFTYGSELPADVGFPMFGTAHLVWLLLGAAATLFFALRYRRSGGASRRRQDKAAACFLVGLIAVRSIYLILIRQMNVWELPLHLCSLAGFLCLWHAYRGRGWLGQTLYAICLPGTLAALLFPDWVYYPPVHFITIEGFLFHFGVVVYVVFQLISGRIRPDFRKAWTVFAFLLVAVPPVYLFDRHFGTNYMFVNYPSPGSPLELFAARFGDPGYLLPYAALVAAIVLLMELPGLRGERRGR